MSLRGMTVTVVASASAFGGAVRGQEAEPMPMPDRLPRLTVPLVSEAPQIDGRVDEREWAYAAKLPPLILQRTGRVDPQQTEVYVLYTAEALYVGWRLHRPSDAGPMQLASRPAEGGKPGDQRVEGSRGVWRDDAVEVFLDIDKTSRRTINFAGNASGAYSDGLSSPTTDASHDWPWRYAARQTEFGWTGELAIAFADLGLEGPPQPGSVWGFDFVRDNKTPIQEVSFYSYRENWHDLGKHSVIVFNGPVPAVRILQAGPVAEGSVGALVELINPSDRDAQVRVVHQIYRLRDGQSEVDFLKQVDAGTSSTTQESSGLTMASAAEQIQSLLRAYELVQRQDQTLAIEPGRRAALNLTLADAAVGQYLVAYQFSDSEGKTLASAILPAARPAPLTVEAVPYYLDADVIEVTPAFHGKAFRERVATVRLTLHHDGQMVEEQVVPLATAERGVDLSTARVPVGPYQLRIEATDSQGRQLAELRRELVRPERPFWDDSTTGTSAFVPEPWTPVQVSDSAVEVWGRRYQFEGGFLPSQMEVLGEPLFAAAPRLELSVNGKDVALRGERIVASQDPEQVTYRWSGQAGGVPVTATTRVEFDGFITMDLELAEADATVDRMTVVFPLRSEQAQLYTHHEFLFEAGPNEHRPPQPGGRVGSGFTTGFNYAIWLGTTQRGFQWCAESYEHWSNQDRARAIEVVPAEGSTQLRLRVIDQPTRLERPLTYRWGLIATPVKPQPDWYHDQFYYFQGTAPLDFPGDPEANEQFYDQIRRAKVMGATWFNAWAWNPRFFGQPILEDPQKIERAKAIVQTIHDHGFKATLYNGWNSLHTQMKDWPFFGQAMFRKPARFNRGSYSQCTRGGYEDYLVNGIVWQIRELGVDGVYLDSTAWPQPCADPHHGCGFVDPKDGTRRVTVNIWSNRSLFKRLYKLMHGELIDHGCIYSHAGQTPLLAVESFIDIKHCGEAAYYSTDYYTLDHYLARYNPEQYGWPIEHTWNDRAPVARNTIWAIALVHGNAIKMYEHAIQGLSRRLTTYQDRQGIDWRLWVPRQWFNWDGARWHPYYRNADLLTVSDAAVLVSFHQNDQSQLLVYAANLSSQAKTVSLRFDLDKLGLPPLLHGRDPVTNEAVQMVNGEFDLEVLGQRPRVLMFAPSAVEPVEIQMP